MSLGRGRLCRLCNLAQPPRMSPLQSNCASACQMVLMKKRAREARIGKFVAAETAKARRKCRGRSRQAADGVSTSRRKGKAEKPPNQLNAFEVSITLAVGREDGNCGLIKNISRFLTERSLAGKCSLERAGAAFHLHFQMVARIEAKSVSTVSKILKEYLGWDKKKPAGGVVICKKLANTGLHTFYGMIGYCMNDIMKDHFETIDHNISTEDMNIGMEQYVLFGQEENKTRVVLTMGDLSKKVCNWGKRNCKHPIVVNFNDDLYTMSKTGKYYASSNWVVGDYGKDYDPARMQSLYLMMVVPQDITRQDISNVFETPDLYMEQRVPHRQWFEDRWKEGPEETTCKAELFKAIEELEIQNEKSRVIVTEKDVDKVLTYTRRPRKEKMVDDEGTKTKTPAKVAECSRKKKPKKVSPTWYMWPMEWNVYPDCSSSCSKEEDDSSDKDESGKPGDYKLLYVAIEPLVDVS